ncbi:MAG TPA: helix-turn-helix transcriptional regulator [Crocinitomicaceae bacterium]|nr:helix-turn-helix transcriptional regulator [Crocinitomicaceae bacterium]
MNLHDKIKVIRLSKNYTQNFLADELGIDVTNYSRLERGEVSISVERLKKIAKTLGVNASIIRNHTVTLVARNDQGCPDTARAVFHGL